MAGLEDAIWLAVQAHRGQVDKAGSPYVLHALRVMLRLDGEAARIAGVLHDVIEDTDCTLDQLRELGYSPAVLDALDRLTHRPGDAYDAYIDRVEASPLARAVKLADLEDNLDVRRLPEVTPRDAERLTRYRRVWDRLRRAPDGP